MRSSRHIFPFVQQAFADSGCSTSSLAVTSLFKSFFVGQIASIASIEWVFGEIKGQIRYRRSPEGVAGNVFLC
jgi:hypothetical protein